MHRITPALAVEAADAAEIPTMPRVEPAAEDARGHV
eukprot:CAMPEP_0183536576 /NCGR_PEP_ID=MMETSP0371-20130417/28339_1 /TAXON_ID=268820 /ORGANISM="Peridinium aciculiferum, Strain PAER-2" /LENGTH=35 /DNA_ID= /DNA_START= /DNA_END= /DNA_ORIENTATION=